MIRLQTTFFHDGGPGTFRCSVQKTPKPKRRITVGKRNSIPIKNNLMINAESKVVLLTPSCEGRIHDKRIAEIIGYSPPCGSSLYQDAGFQGFACPDVAIIQPKKKPKGRQLTVEEKAKNREISSIRIRVEHAIGGIKRYRIVKDKLRNSKSGFSDLVMETCCGLHNFRLNFRPWTYQTHVD